MSADDESGSEALSQHGGLLTAPGALDAHGVLKPPPVIEVRHLRRSYSSGETEVRALDDVSLQIQPGEFVAIMGPSGSGKSTLMAILGCLDQPDTGSYLLKGHDVTGFTEAKLAMVRNRYLGFVFQSFNLLPRTSALDNVALPLLYAADHMLPAERRRQRARVLLKFVGLQEREGHTPAQLSGGQQQRVAIARALVNSPKVLLADEPTGNLDSRASQEVMRILRELNRTGLTIVMVTHEADVAAHASRIVTLRDGRIASDEMHTSLGGAQEAAAFPVEAQDQRSERLGRLFRNRPRSSHSKSAGMAFFAMVMSAALTSIRRNRLRSVLTMLGIFIGVASLVAMVAVGEGASASMRHQLEGLGTHLLVVLPHASDAAGARGIPMLTQADAQAITRKVTAADMVGYGMQQAGPVVSGGHSAASMLQGVSLRYPELLQWRVLRGRSFSESEEAEAALVCLIGQTVWRHLFNATQNPVGAVVLVRGTPMRVIGLLAPKGQTAFGTDQDDVVMMPFTTAEGRVLGTAGSGLAPAYTPPTQSNPLGVPPRLNGQVHVIYVRAQSEQQVAAAEEQTTQVLSSQHGLRDGQKPDFSVGNLSQLVKAAKDSGRTMAIMLAALSSTALLVGGIGIMNIMLVSVTERTREIGLRMAIGARRRQVLTQFLAEATMLSTLGGVVGILVGALMAAAISAGAGWPVLVSMTSVVGGFFFSLGVGLVFGVVPARKAASLEPMQAMRHE